jgi:hypothetical protein
VSVLTLVVLAPIGLLVALVAQKPMSSHFRPSRPRSPSGTARRRPLAFGSLSSILGLLLLIGLLLRLMVSRRQWAPLSATVFLWLGFLTVAATTTLWSLSRA